VNRLTVPAVYFGAFLMMASCPGARASVDFSGRLAVSADHAGQSFLQVILDELGEIESLPRVEDSETTYNAMLDMEWEFDLAGPHRLLLENRLRHGTAVTRDRLRLGYRYRDDNDQRFDLDSETDILSAKPQSGKGKDNLVQGLWPSQQLRPGLRGPRGSGRGFSARFICGA